MVVLDTNTVIYFFKGRGDVARRLLAVSPADVGVPAIVVHELETGIAKSSQPRKRRAQLYALLDVVQVLPFDREAAGRAARVRARLEAAGTPIGPLDVLIAGTALRHGATLVTSNSREFSRVPGLELEDWLKPGP